MEQHYPEPWELQAFADEPMVFTDVNDITLEPDGSLVGGEGVVEYSFAPTFIRIEPADGEGETYEVSENPDAELDHSGVWNRQIDTEVEANTITVTTFTTQLLPEVIAPLVVAHWSLDEVRISAGVSR